MVEKVDCPVCGSNQATEIWSHVSGIADGVCLNCGHAYLTRQKTEKEIIASYKNFRQAYPEAYLADTKNDLFEQARWRYEFLAQNIPTAEAINSVLEVGCAYGHFLSLFSPKVIRAGIEPSMDQAAFAKKHFNLSEIINSPYELIDKKPKEWPGHGFDLFCSYHVIEHVKNPSRLLAFARRMLKPNGYICLAAPNLFTLSPDIIEYFFLFKNWHLNIFSPSSLSRLLAQFGFETLHWEVEPPTTMFRNSFIVLARKQTISPVQFVSSINIQDSVQALADFHNILDRCIHSIRQAFDEWHHQGLTIYIYGAGIHTTALLELSDIERKYIKFIIDDDPKKWGLEINDIQVINLDNALSRKPDVILVSSLASEEIILQKLGQCLRTGIKLVGVYRDLAPHLK
ncbi:MAG: class I SAM-dependent methyltransferase [Dissulfurimicrobium hydrothermale]|uniref:class I SAM-dependent methyltransferase n=1 Tax=Dissulfurimicrobium hydrothermale TaxID=1750598 RepID=UPI003C70E5CA